MVTSSYVHLIEEGKAGVGGRIIKIPPGSEVRCAFQIIVETFLDRLRHSQVRTWENTDLF